MSFLDRIRTCHRWRPERYRPFVIDGTRYGWIDAEFAARLARFPDVFATEERAVHLRPELDSFDARSAAVADAMARLRYDGALPYWRGELYPVTNRWDAPPVMALERGAVPLFGVRAYGLHLNGLVRTDDGIAVWVGKRAASRKVAPGRWDQMVAGGQPIGLSVRDNMIKECAEEAGVPAALAATAIPAGLLAYVCEQPDGLRDDIAFLYDLWLPPDFVPTNTDGEVARFERWSLDKAVAAVRDSESFKFNCALVMIDLFVRHGALTPEDDDYQAIVEGLQGRV